MKSFLAAATLVAGLVATTAANAGKLEDIQQAGVIRVGIALTGEPIGFRDADNNPVGYDVDVANRLATALGVKLEITEVSGAVRITMLQSGQIDVVIANMTATLERAKAVDFSIPYLKSGIKLLTRADTGVKSIADLKGKKVVVGRGTTGEMTIRAGTARAIVLHLRLGYTLEDAVAAAAGDLAELRSGQIGTVVIHAIDGKGRHRVVSHRPTEPISYWLWTPGMAAPERRSAEAARGAG
jgi:ABC-type amino acid transport substrate-binding protein